MIGVRLELSAGARPADVMTAVHEASATDAYAHIFRAPFPVEETRRRWDAYAGRVWLAWRDADLVGFAAATGAEVDAVYVLPREAGAGIGSALLAALGPVSRLWVLEDNAHARRWYERRGWEASGERQPAYGVWEVRYLR